MSKDSEHQAERIDDLSRLWLCLSQLDPRLIIKEQALLECIQLQRNFREHILMDPGIVYSFYGALYLLLNRIINRLLKENQREKALEVIKRGRSQSSSNLHLLFLESLYHYQYDSDSSLSLQLAETCCLTAFLPESHALFSFLSFPFVNTLIHRSGPLSKRAETLLLQSANFLLQSLCPRLHLLAARTFIRLHLYAQALAVCESIQQNSKEDSSACTTAKLLYEFIQGRLNHSHISQDTSHSFLRQEGDFATYLRGDETEVTRLMINKENEKQEVIGIIHDNQISPILKSLKVRLVCDIKSSFFILITTMSSISIFIIVQWLMIT